ncbi:hypothetical protein [Streptomyces sp. NRRL F-5755]|uniref:hypothetical protein n=1 Tax=Streptomyces sp. NRRL F-5755 TaxID=1519475 RepID=UPI0007C75045|nr:hypothetical protein [Streptomyces sp. NRRL F-5755]
MQVNTLPLQDTPSEEKRQKRLIDTARQALSPLLWTRVTPYGRFEPGMNSHFDLAAAVAAMVPGPLTVPEAEAARSVADDGVGSAS